ncbi:MAG TPA: Holliday junction branch migration protein RuvA [Aestuariivirgaceae bacterium]|nr:Holliday junction branch migration protein RuvA [Aestuariivirgaceae bacterium]
MIGKLKGRIETYGADWVTVDVGGVGYHVSCSTKTMMALPPQGEFAEVYTEMLVSPDSIRLIGFASELERQWFRLLQTVQGVGARVALSVLSALSTSELANSVALQDKAMIMRAQGVGKKVAERIVTELRDKAPAMALADPMLARLQSELEAPRPSAAADAVSALVNLGYGQAQAGLAVGAALKNASDGATAEGLIRLALKELAR